MKDLSCLKTPVLVSLPLSLRCPSEAPNRAHPNDVCPGCLNQRLEKYSGFEAATTQPPLFVVATVIAHVFSSPAISFTQFRRYQLPYLQIRTPECSELIWQFDPCVPRTRRRRSSTLLHIRISPLRLFSMATLVIRGKSIRLGAPLSLFSPPLSLRLLSTFSSSFSLSLNHKYIYTVQID